MDLNNQKIPGSRGTELKLKSPHLYNLLFFSKTSFQIKNYYLQYITLFIPVKLNNILVWCSNQTEITESDDKAGE